MSYEVKPEDVAIKLPQDVKAQWVEALRSGKYHQGQERLRTRYTDQSRFYCCLGVLCEVQGVLNDNGSLFYPHYGNINDPDELVRPLLAPEIHSALWQRVPVEGREGTWRVEKVLSHLNDIKRLTFDDIADWIEEHL